MRQLRDTPDVRRRSHRVRGDRKRDDTGSLGELRREIVVVELEVLGKAGDVHDEAEVVGELEPRRDVRVVVECGDDDLVALTQRPRERTAQQEVERGHALPECGLVRVATEECRRFLVSDVDELGRPTARLVRRADVRVVLAQVARDRVDDLVRTLPCQGRRRTRAGGRARRNGRGRRRYRAWRYSQDLLAVDDPAMTWSRGERVRDEAAVLRPGDELLQCSRLGRRSDVDLERGLDGDECVEPVVSLRDRPVRAADTSSS